MLPILVAICFVAILVVALLSLRAPERPSASAQRRAGIRDRHGIMGGTLVGAPSPLG